MEGRTRLSVRKIPLFQFATHNATQQQEKHTNFGPLKMGENANGKMRRNYFHLLKENVTIVFLLLLMVHRRINCY